MNVNFGLSFGVPIIVRLLLALHLSSIRSKGQENNPENDLSLAERATFHGYPVEVYELETEDNYLITTYRIPRGQYEQTNESSNKSAVLIVHGNGGSPQNFLVLGRGRGSAFYFADEGLDVWLFSARGLDGAFNRHHKIYDRDRDPEYWDFSYHDIGIYDLSATIDFILNKTGQRKVTVIGHSAGGPEFFCLFSERPDYVNKVKLAVSWAASPIIKRMDCSLFLFGCYLIDIIKALMGYLGYHEVPFVEELKPTLKLMCTDPYWKRICTLAIGGVGGQRTVLLRPQDAQLIIAGIPRMSLKQNYHFMDNINSGSFRKYDYGPKKNLKLYGQVEPPKYNLSAAAVPFAFFYGPNDPEIVKEDILETMSLIPNPVFLYRVPFERFNHIDFIFGLNATELVYEPTVNLIRKIDTGRPLRRIKVPPFT